MTMEVTPERIKEIITELNAWNTKTAATRKEVESIIGKLQFASKCAKPGRTFIARLITWLRGMNRQRKYKIPSEARKDLAWWGKFLEQYNGISVLWLTKIPEPDKLIASDACLKGFGAVCGKEYLRGEFTTQSSSTNIAHLEILAVLAAVRTWTSSLTGKYFWVHVDNEAVATVINSGASRDQTLQAALREILMIAAHNDFMIKAKHIKGVDNRIPDWLSRWHEPEARGKFQKYNKQHNLCHIKTKPQITELTHKW